MTDPKPQRQPQAITCIREAVSNLLMPPLAPLFQVFMDQKAGINEKRSELRMQMEDVRIEGYGAATRLMLPNAEHLQNSKGSYFERIHKQRSKNHEK